MDRNEKAEQIVELSQKFGRAKAAFVVDFKGMAVQQVTQLRKQLFQIDAEMRVVRNTLAKRALNDHPQAKNALEPHLVGTNAVVFSFGDVGGTAKVLSDFAKENEHLELKSGVLDGRGLNKAGMEYLATLPPKEVLRAQLLGLMAAPATKFVCLLNAVPSGFVRVLSAKNDAAS